MEERHHTVEDLAPFCEEQQLARIRKDVEFDPRVVPPEIGQRFGRHLRILQSIHHDERDSLFERQHGLGPVGGFVGAPRGQRNHAHCGCR